MLPPSRGSYPTYRSHNLLVEPGMRGTGTAIALAALLIARRDPDAIMGSFAADHRIANTDEFQRALRIAIESAEAGYLTTIGIEPDHPETGYGYIERSDDLALPGAYFARRFVEKPNAATAQQFLESGRYLWNASMFVWRVDVFLRDSSASSPISSPPSTALPISGTIPIARTRSSVRGSTCQLRPSTRV